MTAAVRLDVADEVATLVLDQPDTHNALSIDLVDDLRAGLDAALADADVRVIVLTNAGPTFCAGADLRAGTGSPPAFPSILADLLDSPKPVVGRIAGGCFGGGVGLAAACDISIVAESVRFGFTEVRLGVAPAVISVVCLPKLRPADALELFLTGERIPAARAAEIGLVARAVPDDQLDAAVADTVAKLRLGGPNALAAAKQLIRRVPTLSREDAFAWTAELSAALFGSEEAAAGTTAFRAKQPPPWARG